MTITSVTNSDGTISAVTTGGAVVVKLGFSPYAHHTSSFSPNLGDINAMMAFDSTSPIEATFDSSQFIGISAGSSFDIVSLNTGVVTLHQASDFTLVSFANLGPGDVNLAGQYAACSIFFLSSSMAIVIGNVVPVP
jgi:hypothetical protein